MRLIESRSYNDPKENNPFILSNRNIRDELIYKYLYMEEEYSTRDYLT